MSNERQRRINLARFDPASIRARARDVRFQDRRDEDDVNIPRSLAQPFILTATPHNELDPSNPHENGDHTFDHEEGVEVLPEPCWDQFPSGEDGEGNVERRYYNPTKQWGDRKIIAITDLSTVPGSNLPTTTLPPGTGTLQGQSTSAAPNRNLNTGQLIDLRLNLPAVCLVRLSSVEITGQTTGTSPNLFVEWTVDIGCGRALQRKFFQQLVAPLLGQVETQILFQMPLQALRVSGQVFDLFAGVSKVFQVECLCAVAPFTSYPDMVSP